LPKYATGSGPPRLTVYVASEMKASEHHFER
jgi:hypothetical protein